MRILTYYLLTSLLHLSRSQRKSVLIRTTKGPVVFENVYARFCYRPRKAAYWFLIPPATSNFFEMKVPDR